MSIVLGLDLSISSTGFFVLKDDIEFGTIKTKPADFENDIIRVDHICNEIMKRVESNNPDLIMMEDYFVGANSFSVIKLVTLGSIVRYRLYKSGRKFMTIAPTQLKKFQTGNGNAKKDNMILSVYKKFGFDTDSNDMADACAVAHFGDSFLKYISGKKEGFSKYELEVLKSFEKKTELNELSKEQQKKKTKGKKNENQEE